MEQEQTEKRVWVVNPNNTVLKGTELSRDCTFVLVKFSKVKKHYLLKEVFYSEEEAYKKITRNIMGEITMNNVRNEFLKDKINDIASEKCINLEELYDK